MYPNFSKENIPNMFLNSFFLFGPVKSAKKVRQNGPGKVAKYDERKKKLARLKRFIRLFIFYSSSFL